MIGGAKMAGEKRIRVIVLSDAKNEADDAFAIVHALLTPSFDVRGIIAGHFGVPGSVEASMGEIETLRQLLGLGDDIVLAVGAPGPLESFEKCAVPSDSRVYPELAIDLIACEAMSNDSRPLYLLCMGALTDVALLLRAHPEVKNRLTVVWTGGGRYPRGGHEANLARDVQAAIEVFDSGVPIWQLPSGAYKQLAVPLSELRLRVVDEGDLGAHLMDQLEQFIEANVDKKDWVNPESWVLGDQAVVGVLLAEQKDCYDLVPAPGIDADTPCYTMPPDSKHMIRVYRSLNERLVLEDMYSKLRLFARARR